MKNKRELCHHCKKYILKKSLPRPLCGRCNRIGRIRDLYPSKLMIQKIKEERKMKREQSAPLPVPTTALPKTEEKSEVMCTRRKLKQQLFHPDDAQYEPWDFKKRKKRISSEELIRRKIRTSSGFLDVVPEFGYNDFRILASSSPFSLSSLT